MNTEEAIAQRGLKSIGTAVITSCYRQGLDFFFQVRYVFSLLSFENLHVITGGVGGGGGGGGGGAVTGVWISLNAPIETRIKKFPHFAIEI